MIPLHTWLLFVLASVALAATPGPNLLYLVSRTLVQGRVAGFVSLAGTATGLLVHVVAAALGLSALLAAVPMAYDAVRWVGALYLAWLAWQTWREGAVVEREATASTSHARLWRDGVATGVLNPKVALFELALFPQFVDPAHGDVLAQSLVLGATQLVIVVAWDSLCVVAAGGVRAALGRHVRAPLLARRALACVFAGLAARLVFDIRRS